MVVGERNERVAARSFRFPGYKSCSISYLFLLGRRDWFTVVFILFPDEGH